MTTFTEPIAHHLGWAVHDADVTAARYTQMLGAQFKLQPIYEFYDFEDLYKGQKGGSILANSVDPIGLYELYPN